MIPVSSIRSMFRIKLQAGDFAEDGNLEIMNACFTANEPVIFGTPNYDWHARELAWYESQSLNVKDIQEPIPKIWQEVSGSEGEINSNYGWCIWSQENGYQYHKAIAAILNNKNTRQAAMIYNRPSMHEDAVKNGMKDFMCTYAVQLMVRQDRLNYLVYMRSNDAVHGYKGDWFWHDHVFDLACKDLNIKRGNLYWNAASLHVYPRHFGLVK